MTRYELKYYNAIQRLRREYAQAIKDPIIKKPLSYALYQVWRHYDATEKEVDHEE